MWPAITVHGAVCVSLHRHTGLRSVRIMCGLGSLLSYFEFMQSEPEIDFSPSTGSKGMLPCLLSKQSLQLALDTRAGIPEFPVLACFLPSVSSFQI